MGLAVLARRPANAQESPGRPDVTESVNFDEYFLPQTMRVDYYHSGDAAEDRIALERVIRDGSWAGSATACRRARFRSVLFRSA